MLIGKSFFYYLMVLYYYSKLDILSSTQRPGQTSSWSLVAAVPVAQASDRQAKAFCLHQCLFKIWLFRLYSDLDQVCSEETFLF